MATVVKLKKDSYGDSRTAPKDTTFEQFHEANISHIKDVRETMAVLADLVKSQGNIHDWTKLRYEEEFWKDFQASLLHGADFVSAPWYQRHIHEEAHHPTSYCHENINLIHVIEMIVDCVCAGKARTGEVRPMEINDEILKKAFENTVKLIDSLTELEETPENSEENNV